MSNVNLLLEIYFDERDNEGLAVLQGMLSRAQDPKLRVSANGRKSLGTLGEPTLAISQPFSFVECTLTVGADRPNAKIIDVRYRPGQIRGRG